MRRFALILTMLVLLPVTAEAQTSFWAESQNHVVKGGYTPTIDFSVTHKSSEKLGVFLWALVNDAWGEAIVGGVYTPTANVEFDLGVGLETDEDAWRTMGSLFIGGGRTSLLLVGELGGSGYWYLAETKYQMTSTVAIGLHGKRFVGFGPIIDVAVPRTKFSIWLVPTTWDPEDSASGSVVLGFRFKP